MPQYPGYPPRPASSAGGGGAILFVVGMISLTLVILCGGGAGLLWWGYTSVAGNPSPASVPAEPAPSPPSYSSGSSNSTTTSSSSSAVSRYAPPRDVDEARTALDGDPVRVRIGAEYLARAPVDESRRTRVEQALASSLLKHSGSEREALLEALAKWGTAASAPQVASALRQGKLDDRQANLALRYLIDHGDNSAAQAAVKYLESSTAGAAAADYLKIVGPSAKRYVIDQFHQSRDVTRARDVLASYGEDTEALLLDRYVADLNSADTAKVRDAAGALSGMSVNAAQRQRVAKALESALPGASSYKDDVLKALKTWGGAENVPAVSLQLSDNSSSVRDAALDALIAINDLSAAASIAEHLDSDSSFSASKEFADRAAAALKRMGPEVKPYVLKQLHSGEGQTRDRVRRLLGDLGVPPVELYEQTLTDLKNFDEKRKTSAVEWLATAEVEPTYRSAIASELAAVAAQESSYTLTREASKALARWATKEQAPLLIALIKNDDDEVMRTALGTSLSFEDPALSNSISLVLGERMGDKYRLDDTALALARIELQNAGDKAEDVLIGLLRTGFRAEVVYMAAQMLQTVGTEKALPTLSQMASYARSKGALPISTACNDAQKAIRARADAAKQAAEGEAANKEGEAANK